MKLILFRFSLGEKRPLHKIIIEHIDITYRKAPLVKTQRIDNIDICKRKILMSKKAKKPMTRSQVMSRVRSNNTKIEMLLRRELWKRGLRYRANVKIIFGKPDIAFIRKKIAIFVDSEFWHGKDYPHGRNIPKENNEYWVNKIERNIARDKLVTNTLKKEGWKVIRIWAKDLEKNLSKHSNKIQKTFDLTK